MPVIGQIVQTENGRRKKIKYKEKNTSEALRGRDMWGLKINLNFSIAVPEENKVEKNCYIYLL